MGWKIKNVIGYAAAPFTGGASLLMTDTAKDLYNDITGKTSARQQNEAQKALQKETNDLSISLANSAHQREVEDLKKAGLNPVLSAGGSGAVTPTLGTAQVQNEMPGGLMSQAGQIAQIANLAGTAQQAVSNSSLAQAQAQKTQVDTALAPKIAKSEITKNIAEAEHATSARDYNQIKGQVDMMLGDAQTEKALAEAGLIRKDTKGRITMNAINTGANAISSIGSLMGGMKGLPMTPITVNSNSARSYNYNGGYVMP